MVHVGRAPVRQEGGPSASPAREGIFFFSLFSSALIFSEPLSNASDICAWFGLGGRPCARRAARLPAPPVRGARKIQKFFSSTLILREPLLNARDICAWSSLGGRPCARRAARLPAPPERGAIVFHTFQVPFFFKNRFQWLQRSACGPGWAGAPSPGGQPVCQPRQKGAQLFFTLFKCPDFSRTAFTG